MGFDSLTVMKRVLKDLARFRVVMTMTGVERGNPQQSGQLTMSSPRRRAKPLNGHWEVPSDLRQRPCTANQIEDLRVSCDQLTHAIDRSQASLAIAAEVEDRHPAVGRRDDRLRRFRQENRGVLVVGHGRELGFEVGRVDGLSGGPVFGQLGLQSAIRLAARAPTEQSNADDKSGRQHQKSLEPPEPFRNRFRADGGLRFANAVCV